MKRWVASAWVEWARQAPSAALAVGLGGLIVLARVALQGVLGAASPFILAWPAAMIAAFVGGFWPAIVVSVLGLLVGQWALQTGGVRPLGPGGAAIFMAFGCVFAAAGGMRKRGLKRAAADAERLNDMQRRLAGVARLNAMGEIAATLAHELNQPLTAIASYAGAAQRLVQRDAGQPANVGDLLDKVSGQASRANEIIGRIRGYVTKTELSLAPQSLSEMFDEALAIVTAGAGRKVAVRREFDAAADRVLADRVQLQQVMLNLIRNAVEAMAEAPRRELTLGGRAGPAGFVEAWVSDTGPGLPPELAERLFEPFVTGKSDGMGIGLSVCRSIVEAHGGAIRGETAPGGGAAFRFTLRRAP
ncbi:sensor histidine kinase [Phenylobacterium sp.]|uniref:sensor histidine kinase n=1 Tax=Phenylobacterium sp. TaxID=1871053 RepID=UPI002E36C1F2|nr:ATP-binding protein [Phenylobacterium sp.]HEX4712834.1 ATP-binding protein [Phenylobacterium sp.]